jgi:hypothetical protein
LSILVELLNVIFGSGYIYGKCASELINDNLRISREAQIG